ncbi:chymotrypsin-like elastase family member 2A isoform X1 [Petromyzon marinus]|uniref:Transmembrane protease serine 11A-like isoform X1 n=1 Tax=Petromyzon marinus TaxID=7757 RepID=A0AAJ7TNJ4_PETMA|nr:transmembrane protease serine 11A-like isoform X1 [Petromyzon marinus]XP_032821170.1 transmembrane protease serine 11A-like isoform X1 [Petromyzon marinus]
MGTQWAQIALLLQLSSVALAVPSTRTIQFSGYEGNVSSRDHVPNDTDVDFTFLIVAVSRKVIKIKFEWLSLREDAVCANESLSVLDGAARANALAVLCGTSMPSVSFKSTQSNLTLVLRSTGPLVERGFRLKYSSVTATPSSAACGKTSDWRNFPWDVQLFFNSRFAANGTIIGRRWILTTAKQIVTAQGVPKWTIRYSDGVFHSVGIIAVHSRFNASMHDYNVAVVELSKAVPFSDAVSAVCLPHATRPAPAAGKVCYLGNGYGLPLGILSQSDCASAQFYGSTVSSRMLCAQNIEHSGCWANSAQSLVCREEDDRWYVTGLASWGNQCNYLPARAYPGVFTRVYKFLGFIEGIAN